MSDQLSALQLGFEEEDIKNIEQRAKVSEEMFQSKILSYDLVKVEHKLYSVGPIAVREVVYERIPIVPCSFTDAEDKIDNSILEILQHVNSVTVCERVFKDEEQGNESWASSMLYYFNSVRSDIIAMYYRHDATFYEYKDLFLTGKSAGLVHAKLQHDAALEAAKDDEWAQFEQALTKYTNMYSDK